MLLLLPYFLSQEKCMENAFPLQQCSLRVTPIGSRRHCFCVMRSGQETVLLSANTGPEMDEWVEAIRTAIRRHRVSAIQDALVDCLIAPEELDIDMNTEIGRGTSGRTGPRPFC